ncbi:MAG: ATP-binding protein [Bryobacteraceae bacterium]
MNTPDRELLAALTTLDHYRIFLGLTLAIVAGLGVLLAVTMGKLRSAREIARRAAQVKATLLTNLSHEIRTPMNGVMGMTSLLFSTNLTGEQREYAEAALSSAESLLELLNNMLDYARNDEGKLQFENVDFDLHGLLEDVAEHFAPYAEKKRLELACMITSETPHVVTGDPMKLRQILNNLMSNAVKFTAHGEIVLSAKVVSLEPGAVVLHVEVADTGIGIEEEARPKLFHSFGQLDSSSSRTHSGGGMGLAICKQIVTGARGYIDYHSLPGVGSSFWVVMRFGRPAYQLPPTQADKNFAGRSLLVVSGSRAVRQAVLLYCRSLGLEAHEAGSAASALALLPKMPVDLMFLDGRLPNIVKLAEAKPPSAGLIVLAPSSGASAENPLARSEKTRVDAFVSRPMRRLHFSRAVRDCFDHKPAESLPIHTLGRAVDSAPLSTHL